MKKKLYWWLLQLDKIGGTEMVSISLMNKLVDDYDICIISSAKVNKCAYKIDPRIKIISLNIPNEIMTIDQSLAYFSLQKSYISYWKTIFGAIKYMVFKRTLISKKVAKLINDNESILICSAIDSYWLAPKKGRVFFHFHFNKNVFFSFSNRFVMRFSRKPEKLIFLSKGTKDAVIKKYPKLKEKSTYVHNTLRFEPYLNTDYANNNILFLGRFSKEKNPLFALKVANELHKDNFKFHMTLSGHGALQKELLDYVNDNQLNDDVTIMGITPNVSEAMKQYDLVIVPSLHEGFGLTIIEANACSVPVISSNWGDAIDEVMKNGVNGFVIDSYNEKEYADKIKEILNDRQMLINLKKSSYEHAKQFEVSNIIPIWKNILK